MKSKYASSLSQFYMALVVFCMKFFTLNVSKKLSIHFLSTFYIFKTFSGTRAIQRTLNRVFAMRQTQANVDKSVKNVKFCSYVAYLIAYGAIWYSVVFRALVLYVKGLRDLAGPALQSLIHDMKNENSKVWKSSRFFSPLLIFWIFWRTQVLNLLIFLQCL